MKISVITACYNSAGTVGDAIASVARQRHRDVEHLVVEGQSSDESLSAIQSAAHDRMRLISEPDKGVYDALNKGVARSTGDIIGFVHSDDILAHDQVLERVASSFALPGVEAVFSDLEYVSRNDTTRVVRYWSAGKFEPRRLTWGWMPPHPTLYLRRDTYERLGGFDTSFKIAADYDLMLRFFSELRGKCIYIADVTYKMRLGGISNRNANKILLKMIEDYRALRRNNIGGVPTLMSKTVSKLGQYVARQLPPKV